MKTFIIGLFFSERAAIPQMHNQPARHFTGKSFTQARFRTNADSLEKGLHVGTCDARHLILLGHDLVIEKRNRQNVAEAVIGIFFGLNLETLTFFAAADNVVCHVENLQFHRLYL